MLAAKNDGLLACSLGGGRHNLGCRVQIATTRSECPAGQLGRLPLAINSSRSGQPLECMRFEPERGDDALVRSKERRGWSSLWQVNNNRQNGYNRDINISQRGWICAKRLVTTHVVLLTVPEAFATKRTRAQHPGANSIMSWSLWF